MLDEAIRNKLTDRNISEIARRLGVTKAYLHNYIKTGKMGKEAKEKLIAYLLEN